jgi:hypothetical protein
MSLDWDCLSAQQREIWARLATPDALWALIGVQMIIVPFHGVPSVYERDGTIARRIVWHVSAEI